MHAQNSYISMILNVISSSSLRFVDPDTYEAFRHFSCGNLNFLTGLCQGNMSVLQNPITQKKAAVKLP